MNDWKNKVKEQHNAVLYFYLAIANHALVCYIVALKHRAKICKELPVFLCHRGTQPFSAPWDSIFSNSAIRSLSMSVAPSG